MSKNISSVLDEDTDDLIECTALQHGSVASVDAVLVAGLITSCIAEGLRGSVTTRGFSLGNVGSIGDSLAGDDTVRLSGDS